MNRIALVDPVTVKEIYAISRRGQTYFGRVVYIGLIGLILYGFWSRIVSTSPFIGPSEYSVIGRRLFNQFVPMQLILVTLASVGAAADRIIREERAGTLGLLLLTPLSARRIAFSKWTAAMAQSCSLVLCGVPVMAVCVYLGGVEAWKLLWCFSSTVAMAMLGAAFGLRASAIARSVPRALGLGMLYVLGFTLLPLLLIFVAGSGALELTPYLHPVYSMCTLVFQEAGVAADAMLSYSFIPSTLLSAVAGVFIVRSVGTLIERRVRVPRPPALPEAPAATPPAGFRKPPEAPPAPGGVWERDPLLWKELATRPGNRWSGDVKSMALVYSLIFISLCWLFKQGNHLPTFAFLGALFTFLSLVNGASLFAPEKEGRKMEMLLSSPVSSARIVWSKLAAGVMSPESIRVLLLALATALGFSWWSGAGIVLYVGVLFVFLLFAFTLAATASLYSATLQSAALAASGILCVLLLVLPILVSILSARGAQGESLPLPLYLLFSVNPVSVLEPLDQARGEGLSCALGRFAIYCGLYAAAISGLWALMLCRFDRHMGRL
jgi:ABC-type transport system involved in multi-copper enzyme maturation permease subunit